MSRTRTRELVGMIGVDAGMVMVVDPCYIEAGFANDEVNAEGRAEKWRAIRDGEVPEKPGLNYLDCCAVVCNADGHVGELDGGAAVVTESGHGDGRYPVYVERDFDGRVVSLTVEFDEDEDDECDECGFSEHACICDDDESEED